MHLFESICSDSNTGLKPTPQRTRNVDLLKRFFPERIEVFRAGKAFLNGQKEFLYQSEILSCGRCFFIPNCHDCSFL